MKTFTLRPVQESARRTLKSAQTILDAIELLNSVENNVREEEKQALQKTLSLLMQVSDDLMDNATETSKFVQNASA